MATIVGFLKFGVVPMLPWLDSHAGTVQAFAAVASVLLTAMLAYITWRYTNLTHRIAAITEKQLASSIQPVLRVEIVDRLHGQASDAVDVSSFHLYVRNEGITPFKIKAITAFVKYKNTDVVRHEIVSDENIVVMPNNNDQRQLELDVSSDQESPQDYHIAIGVDCTDLAGVTDHSFIYDERQGLRHYFGYVTLESTETRQCRTPGAWPPAALIDSAERKNVIRFGHR